MLRFTNLPFASSIAIMSRDYNTRNKKQEEKNNTSAAIVNLETKLLDEPQR